MAKGTERTLAPTLAQVDSPAGQMYFTTLTLLRAKTSSKWKEHR